MGLKEEGENLLYTKKTFFLLYLALRNRSYRYATYTIHTPHCITANPEISNYSAHITLNKK